MGLLLSRPDHTTLSRRNATVTIRQQVDRVPKGPVSMIVDSMMWRYFTGHFATRETSERRR
jgi:hypothetical protein